MKSISEKHNIEPVKVKIKPQAKINQGEIGWATMCTDEMRFYVTLEREGYTTGLWYEYEELIFLKDK